MKIIIFLLFILNINGLKITKSVNVKKIKTDYKIDLKKKRFNESNIIK